MENLKNIYTILEEKGFIGEPIFEGDIHQPNFSLFNEKGEYLGDFLESLNFTKISEVKKGKTWIMFSNPNCPFKLGHRDLKEYETNSFFWID